MREETFKGYWHAAVAGALSVMVGYNAMRYADERKTRNLMNLCIYLPLVAYELSQARHHWRQR